MPVFNSTLAAFVSKYGTVVIFGAMGALVRFMVLPRKDSYGALIRAIMIAIFVSLMVNELAKTYELSESNTVIVIGISALLADDIVQALLKLGKALAEDPLGVVEKLINIKRK